MRPDGWATSLYGDEAAAPPAPRLVVAAGDVDTTAEYSDVVAAESSTTTFGVDSDRGEEEVAAAIFPVGLLSAAAAAEGVTPERQNAANGAMSLSNVTTDTDSICLRASSSRFAAPSGFENTCSSQ